MVPDPSRAGRRRTGSGFVSPRGLGQLVRKSLLLWGILTLVAVGTGIFQLTFLDTLADSSPFEVFGVEPPRFYYVVSLYLTFLTELGTSFVFLIWLYRVSKNQWALKCLPSHAPSLAVVGWFVPVFHLFVPYRVTAEIWRNSARASGAPAPRPVILYLWWGTYLLSDAIIIVQLDLLALGEADGYRLLDQLSLTTVLGMVGSAPRLLAAACLAGIVHRICTWQERAAVLVADADAADKQRLQEWLATRRQGPV